MKITDTLESLLRLLVSTDDDRQVKERGPHRPLPDWVKRPSEPVDAVATPESPPEPETPENDGQEEQEEASVPGLLEALVSWVQTPPDPKPDPVAEEPVPAPEPEPAAQPETTGELVPFRHDLSHLETAAQVAESLNLGFHLGSAVERIAAAATMGSEGIPALRDAAWLIERYIAFLEKRPIGADLHLTAARLARQGDAIAGLKVLADALEADAASAADEAAVEPEAAAAVPEPEPDILGVGRIRRLSPDPPPAI